MGAWISSMLGDEKAQRGNSGKRSVTEHDRATLDLKVQRDKLDQYAKKLEKICVKEKEAAAKLLKEGRKQQAMRCLKKKKYQEILIKRTDAMYMNLQQMIDSIEFVQVEKKVFDKLKLGNQVLKQLQKEMSIEAVEELMQDTQEAIQYQKEVDVMLSQTLTPEDEDEIAAELENLTTEMTPDDLQQLPSAEKDRKVPSTSRTQVPEKQAISEEDARELAELDDEVGLPEAPKHEVKVASPVSTTDGPRPARIAEASS